MTEKKILVVEDHKDSCLWISAVLRQSGFTAIAAGDGTLAVRLARSERPDLILLDMHLPCGSGEFVLECLQKHESCRHIPVIIMSGDTDLDEDALLKSGADHNGLNHGTLPDLAVLRDALPVGISHSLVTDAREFNFSASTTSAACLELRGSPAIFSVESFN